MHTTKPRGTLQLLTHPLPHTHTLHSVALTMIATIVGIPFLILLPCIRYMIKSSVHSMELTVTDRSIIYRQGVLTKGANNHQSPCLSPLATAPLPLQVSLHASAAAGTPRRSTFH